MRFVDEPPIATELAVVSDDELFANDDEDRDVSIEFTTAVNVDFDVVL